MKTLNDEGTLVIVGPARLSYLSVFSPRKNINEEMEYSVTVLIPKLQNEFCPNPGGELAGIKDAMKAAAGKKFGASVPKGLESCLKDGDSETDNEGNPKQPGYWMIRAKAKEEFKPVLIKADRTPAQSSDDWVSGDWGMVKLSFYGYDQKAKKGVSCGLRAVQFLYKGEPLGQATDPVSVANEFDAVEVAGSHVESEDIFAEA